MEIDFNHSKLHRTINHYYRSIHQSWLMYRPHDPFPLTILIVLEVEELENPIALGRCSLSKGLQAIKNNFDKTFRECWSIKIDRSARKIANETHVNPKLSSVGRKNKIKTFMTRLLLKCDIFYHFIYWTPQHTANIIEISIPWMEIVKDMIFTWIFTLSRAQGATVIL